MLETGEDKRDQNKLVTFENPIFHLQNEEIKIKRRGKRKISIIFEIGDVPSDNPDFPKMQEDSFSEEEKIEEEKIEEPI